MAQRSWKVLAIGTLAAACGGSYEPPPAPPAKPVPAAPGAALAATAEPASQPPASVAGQVVTRGTPSVPAELVDRFGRYLETRSASVAGVADDGRSLLVVTRFGRTNQVHHVRAPLGARTQVTFSDEPVSSPSFVPGGTRSLAYLKDVGGNEQYQLVRADLDAGTDVVLTDGKSRHDSYVWADDGSLVALNGNARNGRDMDLYVSDGRTPASLRRVAEVSGHWYPIEVTRDAKSLLAGEFISINESALWLVDLASGSKKRLTPEQPKASYRAAALDPSGKRLYATTDREGEFVELYEVDLQTSEWRPLTRGIPWSIEEIEISHDGRTVAFVANEDGYGRLYTMSTATRVPSAVPGIARGVVRGLHAARGSATVGFTLTSATENGDAFTLDLATRRVSRWTESEVGGLVRSRFVAPELVRYESFDGRKIPAFVHRPAGKGPHPVMIAIHGGPEAQARPQFDPFHQYLLAESGIAVVVPNVRGSDGYGKSYLLLDNGKLREDSVKDIGALLDWIAKEPSLDASRVAVFGGSYGGYMVLASLVHYPDRIRAGVNAVGISNFVTFLKNTKDYRRDLRRAEYGDERDADMLAFLNGISPLTHVSKMRSALLVAHGANDPRVPLSEADQLVQGAEKGNEVWYVVFGNEGHGFRKKENRDLFQQLAVMFLEKHVGAAR